MSKKKEVKRMGRPPIEINWEQFDKLCGMQCSLIEIAGWFNCSIDTIENKVKEAHSITFSEYFSQKRSQGKISLRRKQYESALGGNVTMLIWLGKQYLGQSDKSETQSTNTDISYEKYLSMLETQK